MKRALVFAIILILAMMLLQVAVGEVTSVQGSIILSKSFTDNYNLEVLPASNYLCFRDEKSRMVGLKNPDGSIAVPAEYRTIDGRNYHGFFAVTKNDGINNVGLINSQGEVVVPLLYDDFDFLSSEWVVAIRLKQTSSEPYDYSGGSKKYQVLDNTIYCLKTGAAAGTLSRGAYEYGKAYGNYLYLKDRAECTKVYDTNLQQIGQVEYYLYAFETKKSSENGYDVFLNGTGIKLFNTKYQVEAMMYNDRYLIAKRGGYGVMDLEGNLIVPCEYDTIYDGYSNGYFKVSIDNLLGLVDTKGQLVLDCKYDEIVTQYMDSDGERFFINGYCVVKNDGKFGYVDESGKETCPVIYTENAKDIFANSAIMSDMEGNLTIIAADGTITHTQYKDIGRIYEDKSGMILCAENDQGKFGVIDWHGNVVLPFSYNDSFTFKSNELGSILTVGANIDPIDVYVVTYK